MLTSLLWLMMACGGQEAAPTAPSPTVAAAPATAPTAAAPTAPPPNDTLNGATPTTPLPVLGPVAADSPLLSPDKANDKAPATYTVLLETSKGNIEIMVTRAWAPLGADRFYNLVKIGFYDGNVFFRVVDAFKAQFGLSPSAEVNAKWSDAKIKDDPKKQSNTRGRVSFAISGTDSRTTQIFINAADNSPLDSKGFAPVGEVTSGMEIVDLLYKNYGEGPPRGNGPDQNRIISDGNMYLQANFPQLDYIKKASIQ